MKPYAYGLVLGLAMVTMGMGCTSWLAGEAGMNDAEKTVADLRPASATSDRPAPETAPAQPAVVDKGAADLLVERPAWPTLKQERPPVKVSLE